MKKRIFLALALLPALAQGQRTLVKLWETDTVFKVPESVLYNPKSNLLYVSNIDGTQPWGRDGKGSIGKMRPDGSILAVEWVTGLNAPKGMGLWKNQLVVADLTELVVIDTRKGIIRERIPITGAVTLNDVTMGANGAVYVSDSRGRQVFKVYQGVTSTLVDSTRLKGPNGLLWHQNDLYILDAGALYRYTADGQLQQLADGMEGGTDGIEPVSDNSFIVSAWAGVIYFVDANGNKQLLQDTRPEKINSADIGYNRKQRIVYVPTFWKNTVAAYRLQ
ncbi:MAG TPA: ATP/GTP-binding protein [Lacibacter sp.]|nr:ATP/GTP-binding protein [Lacibacter sp.]HMO89086.1 ATP/GTP-binding protein [Lacibacter sp.]HMP87752.1 ATP/GTP-binding protein [Lacibacter sp.]